MKTIADLVESFPSRDKTALIHKTGNRTFSLSYRELHDKIYQTGEYLENQGLKKGDKLLLWGFNCPQWGIIFLAAATRGIVIVPVDFLATADFVQKIHEQVNAKAIFHAEFKLPPKLDIPSFVIEHLDHFISDISPKETKTKVAPEDLLEIVFTSGTTGDPKGVMISHQNLASNINSIKEVVDVRPDQTFLSLLPMSHLFEQNPGFLAPLSSGSTVVYMRGLRPNLIFKVLAEEHVTNMVIVPRLLKLFETSIRREVDAKGKTKIFNKMLSANVPLPLKKLLFKPVHKKFGMHFEYFISGGAPLSDDLDMFWKGLGFVIVEGYGLTECAPVLTINPLNKSREGSVGFAPPGITLKLNDKGEVLAKGANITAGYFGRPDKTKELFAGAWMKTGDIGTIDDDGYLFLKGRAKDVIVTGAGMNVYPEDIETLVLSQPGVKDVCVVGLPTKDGEEVHAEIIPDDPKKTDKQKIITEANKQLNDSQQITSSGIWPKDDFPRTTTMKVKKPLVVAEVTGRAPTTSMPPPLERGSKLNSIIASTCEVDIREVKPSATLASDLHLTSVNRIELVALLEQEFNLDLDEDQITASTTVGELDEMIKNRTRIHDKNIFRRWLLSMPIRVVRGVFNAVIGNTLIRLFARPKVTGRENLDGISQPIIIISNHVGYFDAPTVMMSLPWRYRHKVAAAAWKEYFETEGSTFFKSGILRKAQLRFYYEYASVMANAYPFPKNSGFKRSLEYTGELIDKGWSIMFFPEGEHSPDGSLQPFRSGIGWIVKEMKIPIVPIKHSGFENVMAGDQMQWPRFGKVNVKIGKPITLDDRKSIPELTKELQNILAKL